MTTALENAVIQAYKAARRLSAVSLTYSRSGDSVTLTVIPGRSTQTVDTGDETIHEIQTRDYLILASELVLSSSTVTPERGDTVTVASITRDLLSQSGEPLWRYTDQTQKVIRIHTKEQ